jgi:hypothetical protein
MERVITELRNFGIEPEDQRTTATETRTSELLQRIKSRVSDILKTFDSTNFGAVDMETIEFALNAKDTVENKAGSEQNQIAMTAQDSFKSTSLKLDSDKPTEAIIPAECI